MLARADQRLPSCARRVSQAWSKMVYHLKQEAIAKLLVLNRRTSPSSTAVSCTACPTASPRWPPLVRWAGLGSWFAYWRPCWAWREPRRAGFPLPFISHPTAGARPTSAGWLLSNPPDLRFTSPPHLPSLPSRLQSPSTPRARCCTTPTTGPWSSRWRPASMRSARSPTCPGPRAKSSLLGRPSRPPPRAKAGPSCRPPLGASSRRPEALRHPPAGGSWGPLPRARLRLPPRQAPTPPHGHRPPTKMCALCCALRRLAPAACTYT